MDSDNKLADDSDDEEVAVRRPLYTIADDDDNGVENVWK